MRGTPCRIRALFHLLIHSNIHLLLPWSHNFCLACACLQTLFGMRSVVFLTFYTHAHVHIAYTFATFLWPLIACEIVCIHVCVYGCVSVNLCEVEITCVKFAWRNDRAVEIVAVRRRLR